MINYRLTYSRISIHVNEKISENFHRYLIWTQKKKKNQSLISGYRFESGFLDTRFSPPCSQFIRCDEIENFSCRLPPRREARDPIHVLSPLHPLVSNATFRYYIPASTFVKNAVLLRCRKKKKKKWIEKFLASWNLSRISPPHLSPFARVRTGVYKLLEIVLKFELSIHPMLFVN